MAKLTFDERALLTAYRRFYGEKYPAKDGTNTDAHVQAQKMCFLLSLRGVNIGDFGYSWNYHGPYSAGLQSQLRALDQHADLVGEFYDSHLDESVFFSDSNEAGTLFTVKQKNLIDELSSSLKMPECGEEKRKWSELLGSITFLGSSVLPGADFTMINSELKKRKPQYNDNDYNYKAWTLLEKVGIL